MIFENNYFCHIPVVKLILMMKYLHIPLKLHLVKNCSSVVVVHHMFCYLFCRKCYLWKNFEDSLLYSFKLWNKAGDATKKIYSTFGETLVREGKLKKGFSWFLNIEEILEENPMLAVHLPHVKSNRILIKPAWNLQTGLE